jgi:hypothetical protein
VFRGADGAPERDLLIQQGLDAADAALHHDPEDAEALTVKGLLLRLRAAPEPDASRREALLQEADSLRERAIRAQKRRTAGI